MQLWRRAWLQVCLLLFVMGGLAQLQGQTLRLATYNLENYGKADRLTQEGYRKNYPKPEQEKVALHEVIRAMNADVLALQELGGKEYLEELQRDLDAKGIHYPYSGVLEASDADRHIGYLSRLRPEQVWEHRNLDFNYLGQRQPVKRGVLELRFLVEGRPLTLWILHLKSRIAIDPRDPLAAQCRAGEAVVVRDMLLRRHKDPQSEDFAILGDCNDGKGSRPLKALEERGKTIISDDLSVGDDRGHRWTHYHRQDESYEHLDHILLSPSLRRRVLPPFGEGGPAARIVEVPACALASDHRPVLVELSPFSPGGRRGAEDPTGEATR